MTATARTSDAPSPGTPATGGATRGLLQIGDVAERTGLSLRTIRHYEEVGLLVPADRSPGGFRLYTDSAVTRLLVIKQMKPLEFTLDQMRDVLETLDALDDTTTPPDLRPALRDTLLRYRQAADESVAKLRRRLDSAEQFASALDDRRHAG